MKAFNDNKSRTWNITINVAAAKTVRDLLGVNLYKLAENGFRGLSEFLSDPITFIDVVCVLCRDQFSAASPPVTDEDFGRAMGGDSLQSAGEAFCAELIDFFPEARARAGLKTILAKGKAMAMAMLTEAETAIEKIDPAQLAKKLNAGFGNLLDNSGSTPVAEPLPS